MLEASESVVSFFSRMILHVTSESSEVLLKVSSGYTSFPPALLFYGLAKAMSEISSLRSE
jgi:hypothetical protein